LAQYVFSIEYAEQGETHASHATKKLALWAALSVSKFFSRLHHLKNLETVVGYRSFSAYTAVCMPI